VIGHIARGKYAGDTGGRGIALAAALDHEVAAAHVELALEQLRVRLVADRNKHAVDVEGAGGPAREGPKPRTGDAGLIAQDLIDRVVPDQCDLARALEREQPVLQDLFRAQLVAPVNQGHVRGDVRQIQRLLDRRVAAAHHGHRLAPVEKAVAGRACRDALAAEGLFRGQAQILCRGAGGDDERIAGVLAVVSLQADGALPQFHPVDVVKRELGVEALRVAAHPVHELRSLPVFDVARPVVHIRRGHELPALLEPGDEEGRTVSARRVDGGGIPRRTRSQDD
jgi:hypothetical protein